MYLARFHVIGFWSNGLKSEIAHVLYSGSHTNDCYKMPYYRTDWFEMGQGSMIANTLTVTNGFHQPILDCSLGLWI